MEDLIVFSHPMVGFGSAFRTLGVENDCLYMHCSKDFDWLFSHWVGNLIAFSIPGTVVFLTIGLGGEFDWLFSPRGEIISFS